jgi:hypothetical protein
MMDSTDVTDFTNTATACHGGSTAVHGGNTLSALMYDLQQQKKTAVS